MGNGKLKVRHQNHIRSNKCTVCIAFLKTIKSVYQDQLFSEASWSGSTFPSLFIYLKKLNHWTGCKSDSDLKSVTILQNSIYEYVL